MEPKKLIARLSALREELSSEGNHELAARVATAIAEIERQSRPLGVAPFETMDDGGAPANDRTRRAGH